MHRLTLLLLAGAAVIAAGHAAARAEAHKHALLVGISKYERHRRSPRDWPNLTSDRDVAAMKQVLMERFQFAKADIHELQNTQASHRGIVEAFQRYLIDAAAPGDVVVFYYAGHGQEVETKTPDSPDPLDQTFVPWDYVTQDARDGYKTNLRDKEMKQLLARLREKMHGEGSILVIADSCHSGTITRGDGQLRCRGR